jgi:hypothetical protein
MSLSSLKHPVTGKLFFGSVQSRTVFFLVLIPILRRQLLRMRIGAKTSFLGQPPGRVPAIHTVSVEKSVEKTVPVTALLRAFGMF